MKKTKESPGASSRLVPGKSRQVKSMPRDLMLSCEQKKLYRQGDVNVARWVKVAASTLPGVAPEKIRCMHCRGAVRFHKQKIAHGSQDHVEHRSRQDSEHCKGGSYYKGEHKRSTEPVR